MVGVGHLIGYGAGALNLVKIFGTALGDSQFKQLTVIAALALLFAVGVTSYAVHERVLVSPKDSDTKVGPLQMFKKIFTTTMHLPKRIQAICWIQFWAWIGWFPFLFYSPTWVGEVYFRSSSLNHVKDDPDKFGQIGRIGSLALVVFSIVTFTGSVLLPLVIKSPQDEERPFTPRPPATLATLLTTLYTFFTAAYKYKPDLLTAWLISHFIFAGAMSLAPFVGSISFATTLIATCGIPWAIASWAPFAFIGVEVNRLTSPSSNHIQNHDSSSYHRLSNEIPLNSLAIDVDSPPSSPSQLRLHHLDRDLDDHPVTASTGETAGIYLGILNLYTTLPQFVGTFISMLVFAILEPGGRGELTDDKEASIGETGVNSHGGKASQGVNAIAICLFIGALSSLGAAWATRRFMVLR
ncbi:hypothetical protein MMC13_007614 [Lambiella insularis]|nr:hypothetical protein [Lambiella insularis]